MRTALCNNVRQKQNPLSKEYNWKHKEAKQDPDGNDNPENTCKCDGELSLLEPGSLYLIPSSRMQYGVVSPSI